MSVPAALILCLVAGLSLQAPLPAGPSARGNQPPRDRAVRPDGPGPAATGTITGRVTAADTGNPIRRARVVLVPASLVTAGARRGAAPFPTPTPPGGRGGGLPQRGRGPLDGRPQATTNAQGVFEFTGLEAGAYRVLASPSVHQPQYVNFAYGATRPNLPFSQNMGRPIRLADGERFAKADIALPRGGVIAGRVTDINTDALARVQVFALLYPAGSRRGQRVGAGATTDDLGQFRLYGLPSGDYVVGVQAQQQNTFVPPNAPPESEEDRVGFLATFYPGTVDEAAAQRVRARLGAEVSGIEIQVGEGRLFRVSGTVMDSQGRPAAQANGQLLHRLPGLNVRGLAFSTDEQGQFQMRNVPPGDYRLLARQGSGDGGRGGPQARSAEVASFPLTVASDIENIVVTTAPGVAIAGEVVFADGGSAPLPPMRVVAVPGNPDNEMGRRGTAPASVGADRRFSVNGLVGEYVLSVAGTGVYVKSVTVGADDVTDTPREFKTGDRVVITVTSRASTLEGAVSDETGSGPSDAGVLVFPEDRTSWRPSSTRLRRTGVDSEGRFRVPGLMPGRYLAIAMPLERLAFFEGPDFAIFEELSRQAMAVVIGENEHRQLDLKIVDGGGGQ